MIFTFLDLDINVHITINIYHIDIHIFNTHIFSSYIFRERERDTPTNGNTFMKVHPRSHLPCILRLGWCERWSPGRRDGTTPNGGGKVGLSTPKCSNLPISWIFCQIFKVVHGFSSYPR